MATEFELIERYFAHLTPAGRNVRRAIGDDCAVLAVPSGRELAVSIDTLNIGVHFMKGTDARDIGWKSLACGLSDLAAAGAEPDWCTLALVLPDADEHWVSGFAQGFGALAHRYGLSLVGGDTTRGDHESVTVQVAGLVPAGTALARAGAQPGDDVYVSGYPGEAAAGLALATAPADKAVPHLRERLDRPTPRVALGLQLRGEATACIDVSDGLAADVAHIASASDVRIMLERDALPVSGALASLGDMTRVLQWILAGGDDYELCFTLPPQRSRETQALENTGVTVTRIGRVEEGEGVFLRLPDGSEQRLDVGGYQHFADEKT